MAEVQMMQEMCPRDIARVAHIFGDESAAAQALSEYERRLADGENVKIFQADGVLIVGPEPTKGVGDRAVDPGLG